MKKFLLSLTVVCIHNLFAADTMHLVLKLTEGVSTSANNTAVPLIPEKPRESNRATAAVSETWTYDLDNDEPTATRTIGDKVTVFKVLRERSTGEVL